MILVGRGLVPRHNAPAAGDEPPPYGNGRMRPRRGTSPRPTGMGECARGGGQAPALREWANAPAAGDEPPPYGNGRMRPAAGGEAPPYRSGGAVAHLTPPC